MEKEGKKKMYVVASFKLNKNLERVIA